MPRDTRRIVYYLGAVAATTVLFTLLYNLGMATLEHRPQPIYQSLEVVVQTFTTTGYGEDAPWQTPQMNVLMIVMQLAGIGLILTAVDVFAVPWIRNALSVDPPVERRDVTDHVVICGHSPRSESFIEELDARDVDYVLVEADHDTAIDLHDAGYDVIHGNPESATVLDRAGIGSATAVVADVADDTNASIVLAARDAAPDIHVVTLVEDATSEPYHRAAGADDVLSPRQLLGESLTRRVATAVSAAVQEGVTLGEAFELVELSVQEGSRLDRRSYGSARIDERFGVNVVGIRTDGEFELSPSPGTRLEPGTTLLVAGAPERLQDLQEAAGSRIRSLAPQDVVIAGYGQAGSAAHETLQETNSRVTVLDIEEKAGVDVVGDARDPAVLRDAGIEDASVLLLTLADDTVAIFTTLIARELNPELEILVRANEREDTEKLSQAGADYVQSLATVSGRMMASTVFGDEEVLAYDTRIQIMKQSTDAFDGDAITAADIRETGCTVIAVVSDGETVTDFDADRSFADADAVIVAGEDDDITALEERFG
ncbi:potassium channel family protein [Haloplanus halobius]|uniref:potassium channel family protein n=1 Tax=Haloplanus halobius TaxID=2934938 RepID=UPI00200DB8F2|nr:NAD-binding protein [Haloplanus sp. XH21]